jgi:hypothetical protein
MSICTRWSLAIGCITAVSAASPALAQGVISGNEFNPAISLILDGQFSRYSNDVDDYEISGFLRDEAAAPAPEGFSLGETELTASANADDWFYGFTDIVFDDDVTGTEVELEEAYFDTLSLPAGWAVKGGKFLSAIGYHNARHPHSWDFADEPLAYRAMLAGAFDDVGAQVRWVAPTPLFLQLGAEGFRGASFPASGAANDGAGAWTLFANLGGDVGISNSWQAGLSWLNYKVDDWNSDLDGGELTLNGNGDVVIGDLVWKWSPNGNAYDRNFKFQTEYLHRSESGNANAVLGTVQSNGPYDIDQDGLYAQAIYQWRRGWRVGVRYDWLSADNDAAALQVPTPLDGDDRDPQRITAMVDYAHTEFSRLRLQVARDDSSENGDTQVVLQYVLSFGPHGAHQF